MDADALIATYIDCVAVDEQKRPHCRMDQHGNSHGLPRPAKAHGLPVEGIAAAIAGVEHDGTRLYVRQLITGSDPLPIHPEQERRARADPRSIKIVLHLAVGHLPQLDPVAVHPHPLCCRRATATRHATLFPPALARLLVSLCTTI